MNAVVRRKYHFYGRVQHVGFRYKAGLLARGYHVTGYVRNEYDGSVTLEMQGRTEDMDRIVAALFHGNYIQIEDYEVQDQKVVENDRHFGTLY